MSLRVFYDILNQKGTPAFYTDTLANRPAFGFAGRVFISTDSGQIFEDTGSAWTLIADAGVGGGTLSSVCLNGNTTATGIVITAGGLSTNSVTNTGNTVGSVLFAGAGGLESQSNSTFFWDNTNKRLGIGNASPGAPLDVHGTGTQIQVNGTGTNNSYIQFQNAGTSKWRIGNTYNAGANSFDIFNNGLSNTPFSINSSNNLITLTANVTTTGIQNVQNGLNLGYASGGSVTNYTNVSGSTSGINFALGNGTGGANFIFQTLAGYTYTFPATTGTLALTSNLSSYLPLSGGSLTGNLSTNSYISIQNGLGTNQIYLTKSSGDVYGTIQTEAGGNKFSLGNVSNIGTLGTPNITWTSGMLVGINNSSPSYELDVSGTLRATTSAYFSTASGRVGIGTTSPSGLLQVGVANSGIYIDTTTQYTPKIIAAGTISDIQIQSVGNGGNVYLNAPGTSSLINFQVNGAERMRINNSGNVGIGTNSPNALLHLSQNAVNLNLYLQNTSGSGKTWAVNSDNAGSFNIHDTVTNKFTIGSAGYISINGGANYTDAGCVNTVISTASQFCYSGLNSNGSNPRGIYLNFTNTTGGDYAYYLQASGAAKFYVNGNGVIYSTNTSVQAISDIRLKENIRDIDKGLTEINKLKPRLFDWKEGKGTGNKNVMGFIAQEIEEIFPELITQFNENVDSLETFKAIAMSNLIPYLVKAIQELNDKLVRNNIN